MHGKSTSLAEYTLSPIWNAARRESVATSRNQQHPCFEPARTFELKPYVVPDLARRDHLPQLLTVIPRWHTEDELLLEHEVLVVRVELAVVCAEEGHAWGLGGGLVAELQL